MHLFWLWAYHASVIGGEPSEHLVGQEEGEREGEKKVGKKRKRRLSRRAESLSSQKDHF